MGAAKKTPAKRLVQITAAQRVRYHQRREVDEAAFQRLREKLIAARDGGFEEGAAFDAEAELWLDPEDVNDADEIEDVEVQVSNDGGKTWRELDD